MQDYGMYRTCMLSRCMIMIEIRHQVWLMHSQNISFQNNNRGGYNVGDVTDQAQAGNNEAQFQYRMVSSARDVSVTQLQPYTVTTRRRHFLVHESRIINSLPQTQTHS